MKQKNMIFKILPIILVMILSGILFGCSDNSSETSSEPGETASNQEESENEEQMEEDASDNPEDIVKVEITLADGGVIALDLDKSKAPITVENFVTLANDGFYDGLIFHRVIPGFMIQGGDPSGDGSDGSENKIKGEFNDNGVQNNISHKRGVISMARREGDNDSASCQFFITNADASFLDGGYAAFGFVTSGMDVVDKISEVETDAMDKPVNDVVIKSIKVL